LGIGACGQALPFSYGCCASQDTWNIFAPFCCLQVYEDFAVNVAAMPVIAGRKSRIESFAGANCTYTIEGMMGDRRALQASAGLWGRPKSRPAPRLAVKGAPAGLCNRQARLPICRPSFPPSPFNPPFLSPQAGTSHNLGDNFARAFGTRYLDEAGQLQHVYQSSWGMSTRMVGGIIMTHGDDAGLRLPPRLAPIQASNWLASLG
jgi:prolyl-tRNA synthetase